jgi:hypothetical protein
MVKDMYLFDTHDSRVLRIPINSSFTVGRGLECDYVTNVEFPDIGLEQFRIEYRSPGDIYVANLYAEVDIFACTDLDSEKRNIVNREMVFPSELLIVDSGYQFSLMNEKQYFAYRSEGIFGRI